MGVASIQTVDAVMPSNAGQGVELVKVAIQLIIGIITIFKLIKKPKINTEESEKK